MASPETQVIIEGENIPDRCGCKTGCYNPEGCKPSGAAITGMLLMDAEMSPFLPFLTSVISLLSTGVTPSLLALE